MEHAQPIKLDTHAFQTLELETLARELLASPAALKEGNTARTLIKSPDFTTVLSVMVRGDELKEHNAPGPVLVIPVFGRLQLIQASDGTSVVLQPGQAQLMPPGLRHRVVALEDCAFLLIIGPQSKA